jgi:minor histocompatibility antigen H13
VSGIFVALALRFDVSRGIKNRYFNSAFLGYTVGLMVTIIVMNWFQAAQVGSTQAYRYLIAIDFCHR